MQKRPPKLVKVILGIIGVLVGIIIVALTILSVVYTPEYIYRVLVWQESDVYDYAHNFPQRCIDAAAASFYFEEAPDEAHIRTTFETGSQIEDFDAYLQDSQTQAFIVIQDGKVLYEKYFNGTERDTSVTSFSVAKSFASTLIGLAIDDGYISSVNEPITTYLPELADRDPRFADIAIRHLLMMASGLEYEPNRAFLFNGDDPLTTYYPDQRQIALENTHIMDRPGEYFQYNKYHPQLLGMILERSTGKPVTAYLQEKLWEPLGMEYLGCWSLDSEASGFEKMEAGLNARAIDFAKLGQLFLNEGNWNGLQMISDTWVSQATHVDRSIYSEAYYTDSATSWGKTVYHNGQGFYQYMWYGLFRGDDAPDFFAEGDHGQYIYVSPSKKLVIVRNGIEYGIPEGSSGWLDMFYRFVSDF